jgi:hypothetical protein
MIQTHSSAVIAQNPLLVFVFFLCCGASFFGCQTKHKTGREAQKQYAETKANTPVFHIKAKYWYDCKWAVAFTNDNFDSEENIMNTWDASSSIMGNNIVHQLKIFPDENSAIAFAKKFTSWEKCRRWNDSVSRKAERLVQYRKNNPIEKQADYNPLPSCKNEEGKEVIVH